MALLSNNNYHIGGFIQNRESLMRKWFTVQTLFLHRLWVWFLDSVPKQLQFIFTIARNFYIFHHKFVVLQYISFGDVDHICELGKRC